MKRISAALIAIMASALASSAVEAQEVQMRVLGWYPNQPQTEQIEKPFFQNIGERTGGKFQAQFRSLGEVNLKPFEHLRTLRIGAFDIMAIGAGFVAGDDPMFIGHDIPGLALDFDEVKKVSDAWRPILEKRLAERHNAKLLTIAPFPPQILFCKGQINSLADLKGKKVRVASAVASDLVKAMGGVAVTLAGPEVYQGLQRGIVDCGATGSVYANANSWFEVAETIYPLPIGGYSIIMHVARGDFWNRLPDGHKQVLADEFAKMESELWAIAKNSHEDGIRCNLGQQPCSGKAGAMRLVEPSAQDREAFRAIVRDVALPGWFKDCERVAQDCRKQWYDSVGAAIGIKM